MGRRILRVRGRRGRIRQEWGGGGIWGEVEGKGRREVVGKRWGWGEGSRGG